MSNGDVDDFEDDDFSDEDFAEMDEALRPHREKYAFLYQISPPVVRDFLDSFYFLRLARPVDRNSLRGEDKTRMDALKRDLTAISGVDFSTPEDEFERKWGEHCATLRSSPQWQTISAEQRRFLERTMLSQDFDEDE